MASELSNVVVRMSVSDYDYVKGLDNIQTQTLNSTNKTEAQIRRFERNRQKIANEANNAIFDSKTSYATSESARLLSQQAKELAIIESRFSKELRETKEYEALILNTRIKHEAQLTELSRRSSAERLAQQKVDQNKQLYQTTRTTEKASRNLRNSATQIGYQLQDFSVQIQGGTSVAVAFSQQASQLAGILGPGGALLGAVIAISGAVAGPFINSLFDVTNATEDLKNAQENLNSIIDLGVNGVGSYTDELIELAKVDYDLASLKVTVGLIEANKILVSSRERVVDLFDELENLAFSDIGDVTAKTFKTLDETVERTGLSIQQLLTETDLYATGLSELKNVVGEVSSELGTSSEQSALLLRQFANFRTSGATEDLQLLASTLGGYVLNNDKATEAATTLAIELGTLSKNASDTEKTIELLNKVLGTDFTIGAQNAEQAFKNISKSLEDQISAFGRSELEQKKFIAVQGLTEDATKEQIKYIESNVEALYRLDKAKNLSSLADNILREESIAAAQNESDMLALQRKFEIEDIEKNNGQKLEASEEGRRTLLAINKKYNRLETDLANKAANESLSDTIASIEQQEDYLREQTNPLAFLWGEDKTSEINSLIESQFTLQNELLRQQHEQGLISDTEYLTKRNDLYKKYGDDRVQNEIALQESIRGLLNNAGDSYIDLSGQLADASAEDEKRIKKNFLLEQVAAVANATVAYFGSLPLYDLAYASVPGGAAFAEASKASALASYQIALAGIGATTIGGLAAFHGGIDNVPDSMDNESVLIKAGERVVQPQANRELTDFLKVQKQDGYTGGSSTINAPVNISGNVTDEAWFINNIMKQRDAIGLAVNKVFQERPTLNPNR